MTAKRRKIQIGDVFKIKTAKGIAFLQYVHESEVGNLLRVFANILPYNSTPDIDKMILGEESYLVNTFLQVMYKNEIIEFVKNSHVPSTFSLPKFFKSSVMEENGGGWTIHDSKTFKQIKYTKKLSYEESQYPMLDTVNDIYLIEAIEEGWEKKDW